ncbi:MAG: Crp/Fnr family transcriptional regulator [Deltaproteobacteria bacterium]|nr:MAG: Crp/Fnr family transcriptional regulator [Deltaproteobacteria bacterium]
MAPAPALTPDRKRELLAHVPLFQGFAPRDLDALVPAARSITVAARQELFHKGDAGSQLYVVIDGRLKALTTSTEGNEIVFNVMGPGEVFGEVALLSESPRSATVRAIERCDLLVLDRRDFLTFLKRSPDVAVRMLTVLVERLVRVSEFVEDVQFLNLPVRLAKKLVLFADRYGRDDKDGAVKIDLKLSQEEWGDLVGTTRESINKQMRAWGDEGLIRVDAGYVTLLRPEAIERLAYTTL